MSYITVEEVGSQRLDRLNKVLAGIPGGAVKAGYNALKRAGQKANTKSGQFVAARYTLSKSQFMSHVTQKTKVSGGSGGIASLSLSYAGSVIDLLEYTTRISKTGGISVSVKKGGGGTFPHAFVASMYGKTNIYERTGTSRFPVKQLFGPSAGSLMKNEEIIEEMSEVIDETFSERMEHEMLRLLNGW
jgi:hypothetical protein